MIASTRYPRTRCAGFASVALLLAAGQDPAGGHQPPPPRGPTLTTGLLIELLDGDVSAAITAYEAAARNPLIPRGERDRAIGRVLEVARRRADEEVLERGLALVDPELRSALGSQIRERFETVPARSRIGSPSTEVGRGGPSRWNYPWEPERTTSTPATPSLAPRRLAVPLGSITDHQLPATVRARATRITVLRVAGHAKAADRLEADLVARLGPDSPWCESAEPMTAHRLDSPDAAAQLRAAAALPGLDEVESEALRQAAEQLEAMPTETARRAGAALPYVTP